MLSGDGIEGHGVCRREARDPREPARLGGALQCVEADLAIAGCPCLVDQSIDQESSQSVALRACSNCKTLHLVNPRAGSSRCKYPSISPCSPARRSRPLAERCPRLPCEIRFFVLIVELMPGPAT